MISKFKLIQLQIQYKIEKIQYQNDEPTVFFFFVIFNFTNNLYSQSLSSNVLANSGDFVVNENSVSSTIGESLVLQTTK